MPPQQLPIFEPPSELDRLRETLGIDLPNIDGARAEANAFRQRLESALDGLTSEDTSIALFGSLARDEFTSGSDVDWTVLIDGIANPKHLDVAREMECIVESLGARAPGREKIFGKLAFSHEIIHQIGGEDDTNSNTTKRVLLLLESAPIGRRDAFNRVLDSILSRYIIEDARFLQESAQFHVPRFLLNDFARYWRTMAVDFAYKRRTRAREGFAIRNIKLRMSRKLIFVSGLLACFSGHILLAAPELSALISSANPPYEFVRHLRRVFAQTPLEIVASIINCHAHLRPVGAQLFTAYDAFLGVLRDDQKRAHLENLQPEAQNGDSMYQEIRNVSHEFRDAVLTLFFDEGTGLSQLTRMYGIF
jgi:predicted nucleotidyltransferase